MCMSMMVIGEIDMTLPGPVMVFPFTPSRWSEISWRTNARRAMSTQNAMSVISAARKERIDATSVTAMCWEKEAKNARKVTAAAELGETV